MEAAFNNVLLGMSLICFVADYRDLQFIFIGINVNKTCIALKKYSKNRNVMLKYFLATSYIKHLQKH